MNPQIINRGTSPNDGTGDTLRLGAKKINENNQFLFEASRKGIRRIPVYGVEASSGGIGATFESRVADAINEKPTFEKQADEIVCFVVPIFLGPTQTTQKVDFWLKPGFDEVSFGIAGQQLTGSNLEQGNRTGYKNEIVQLGDIGTSTISDYINTSGPYIEKNFSATINGEVKYYFYNGSSALIGLGGDENTQETDYIDLALVEEQDPLPTDLATTADVQSYLYDSAKYYLTDDVINIGLQTPTEEFILVEDDEAFYFGQKIGNEVDFLNCRLILPADVKYDFDFSTTVEYAGYTIWKLGATSLPIFASNGFVKFGYYRKNLGNDYPREWFEQISMDVSKQSTFENHSSEADLQKLGNDLYRVFRFEQDGDHIGNEGDLYMQKSTDFGKTWESKTPVFVDPATDNRNSSFAIINGKFIVFFRKYDATTGSAVDIGYILSNDQGATWDSFTSVNSEFTVPDLVPFGKIFTDGTKHYASFYTHSNSSQCEWLDSVDGLTWQHSQVVYNLPNTANRRFVEPFFEYVGNGTFLCLIRNEEDDNGHQFFQIVSTDGGDTWSSPVATNHYGNELRNAPMIHYDAEGDVAYTIAMPRFRNGTKTPKDVDTPYNEIFVYANKPSEIVSNPLGYRLISEQKSKWQRSFLYGYPSMVKLDNGKFFVTYTEQYYIGTKQYADLFQFYINSNIGETTIAPTIDENYRVKNLQGVWESRDFEPFEWNRTALNDVFPSRIERWNEAYGWGNFRDYGLGGYKVYGNADFSEITTDSQFFLATNTTGFPFAGRSYEGIKIANSGTSSTSTTIVVDRTDSSMWWKRGSDEWKRAISSLDGALLYKGGITNGTNLDTLSEGYYTIAGGIDVGTLTGFPSIFISSGGDIILEVWNTGAYIHQKIVKRESTTNTIIVERVANSGGTFNAWNRIWTDSNFDPTDYAELAGDNTFTGDNRFVEPVEGQDATIDDHFVTKRQLDATILPYKLKIVASGDYTVQADEATIIHQDTTSAVNTITIPTAASSKDRRIEFQPWSREKSFSEDYIWKGTTITPADPADASVVILQSDGTNWYKINT